MKIRNYRRHLAAVSRHIATVSESLRRHEASKFESDFQAQRARIESQKDRLITCKAHPLSAFLDEAAGSQKQPPTDS